MHGHGRLYSIQKTPISLRYVPRVVKFTRHQSIAPGKALYSLPGLCPWRTYVVTMSIGICISTMFNFSKVCVRQAALSFGNSCYTLLNDSCRELWFHIG